MTARVERFGVSVAQRVRAYVDREHPIEIPGRGGRTALVESVGITWHWDKDGGGWVRTSTIDVSLADRLKSGETGQTYSRAYYDGTRGFPEALQALIYSTRPPFRVEFPEEVTDGR